MENFASSAWSQIIGSAAVSALGIAALTILVVGFVVLALIGRKDRLQVRLTVIVLLMLFCGGLLGGAIYSTQPTAASAAVASGVGTTESARAGGSARSAGTGGSATIAAQGTESHLQPVQARSDCGTAWTGWVDPGGGVGNPCPASCARGDELGQSYRVVGFPPRPQTKHKFQCWRG